MTTNIGHSCEPKYQSMKDSTHKLKVYMTGNVKLNKCTCLSVRLKTEFLHVWSLRCLIVLLTACQCTALWEGQGGQADMKVKLSF